MDPQEREQLISAWVAGAEAPKGTALYKAYRSAGSCLDELMCYRPEEKKYVAEDVQEAWEIILAINAYPLPDKSIALLGAGALEDFLVCHGEAYIERVEAQACCDPVFNKLLGCVWQNQMSEAIWQRVQAARDEAW